MRTFVVSHGRDGFQLRLVDRSWIRDTVADTAELACAATGHRLCNSGALHTVLGWADRAETRLVDLPIDRATADALSTRTDGWAFLDDDEDLAS